MRVFHLETIHFRKINTVRYVVGHTSFYAKATLFLLLGTRAIFELIFRSWGVGQLKKNEKDLKMGCVREGIVKACVLKVHICYDNTLISITIEPVVRF